MITGKSSRGCLVRCLSRLPITPIGRVDLSLPSMHLAILPVSCRPIGLYSVRLDPTMNGGGMRRFNLRLGDRFQAGRRVERYCRDHELSLASVPITASPEGERPDNWMRQHDLKGKAGGHPQGCASGDFTESVGCSCCLTDVGMCGVRGKRRVR